MFPNDEIAEQYLSKIEQFSQSDIDRLLKDFLMCSTSLKADESRLAFMEHHLKSNGDIDELACKEYYRRHCFGLSLGGKHLLPGKE